jgi:fructose-bisphosphate aldolase class 1
MPISRGRVRFSERIRLARMTIMASDRMMAQISGQEGFIAALDQSGGSTPGALRLYGIPDDA